MRLVSRSLMDNIVKHPILYVMALPVLLYYAIFHYFPMYGVIIAFQDYVPGRGIAESDWVGLKHFKDFLSDVYFLRVLKNTIVINLYLLIFAFPFAIIFALLLNEIVGQKFRKLTQTVTYMPHFISVVVICGIMLDFTKSTGLITHMLHVLFGIDPVNLLSKVEMFKPLFVGMSIWQEFGWESIIYFAAIAGVNPSLYEAAMIDGASRFKRAIHITIPSIAPTIIILLILKIGNLLSLGWEKIILLYNPMIYESADVISTYVYRRGLIMFEYSFGSSVGLFNSIINFILLITANYLSRKLNETSLW
ncbi:ABC transporter permease subunit [Paenibacillus sp. LMG 31456]|uniref:ABC transporter permease subunit n=1 Tax=Paenibacillus foliorum TaxID=2654974 RepID=A0A972GLQ6_9BACL|nr:ABC transporter permease subunit [Paenibacillus foliorum]NOU93027.1 ABC transporter permease subunit [Paenibacillus foliorum]